MTDVPKDERQLIANRTQLAARTDTQTRLPLQLLYLHLPRAKETI